jgi:hypothetical protein
MVRCLTCRRILPINVPIYQRNKNNVCKCPELVILIESKTVTTIRQMYIITARKNDNPNGDRALVSVNTLPDNKTFSISFELHRALEKFEVEMSFDSENSHLWVIRVVR